MNRRLTPILVFVALAAVACQDVQDPRASFQVRDGEHNPDGALQFSYLHFLPPIVPSPDYPAGATFNASLLEHLTVTVGNLGPAEGDPPDVDPDLRDLDPPVCMLGENPDPGSPKPAWRELANLTVDPTSGMYSTAWSTAKKGSPGDFDVVTVGNVYRICVTLQMPPVGDLTFEPVLLGYRDVMPDDGGSDQPRNTDQAPVYQFGYGSNVNVKFTILDGVESAALCTAGTVGDNYDCTARRLTSNQTATCDNGTCALTTGMMYNDGTELFLIEKFATQNPACWENRYPDHDNPQPGFPLTIDIPQYAGCLRVTVFDDNNDFAGFINGTRGLLEACYYENTGPVLAAGTEQDEAIQLHIQYSTNPNVVWALPWSEVAEGVVVNCNDVAFREKYGDGLYAKAMKFWQKTQEVVNPWFAPPKLYAFHTGFGGHTTLGFEEGPGGGLLMAEPGAMGSLVDGSADAVGVTSVTTSANAVCSVNCPPKVFHLTWALPSQMSGTICDDADNCSSDGNLTVQEGADVTIEVTVTDNGAVDDASSGRKAVPHPAALEGLRPVNGALVYFDDAVTPDTTVPSGKVSKTFDNVTSSFTVTARGWGIGLAGAGGPFDAFNAAGDYTDQPTQLGNPPLTFNVRVCPAPPVVDGNVTAADGYPTTSGSPTAVTDDSQWRSIPVNLGGTTTGTGYLYVTNDCDYLYLAFLMPSDDSKDNKLRFVFSETGTEALYDDVLSLSAAGFRDRYLSQDCIGSKQADCGPDDPDNVLPWSVNGEGYGVAAYRASLTVPMSSQTGWYVYEMKRKLNTTSQYDFTLVQGDATKSTIYFYGAVSLGTGTKGNSEFPDQKGNFKSYGYKYILK